MRGDVYSKSQLRFPHINIYQSSTHPTMKSFIVAAVVFACMANAAPLNVRISIYCSTS